MCKCVSVGGCLCVMNSTLCSSPTPVKVSVVCVYVYVCWVCMVCGCGCVCVCGGCVRCVGVGVKTMEDVVIKYEGWMWMCVCMYVCGCICVYVCMYVCVRV